MMHMNDLRVIFYSLVTTSFHITRELKKLFVALLVSQDKPRGLKIYVTTFLSVGVYIYI